MLESIFSRFGYPETIVSDNGTQFTSDEFKTYCKFYDIKHITSSPYHPSSNGQAERFVDTFKRSMKKLEGEGNLDENLETFLKTYRTSPNENCESQKSPAEVLLKRKIRTIFNQLQPKFTPELKRNLKMEDQYNIKHNTKHRSFNINDKVFVKTYKQNNWLWEEGIITKKLGNVNYIITTSDRTIKAHTNQIKNRF